MRRGIYTEYSVAKANKVGKRAQHVVKCRAPAPTDDYCQRAKGLMASERAVGLFATVRLASDRCKMTLNWW